MSRDTTVRLLVAAVALMLGILSAAVADINKDSIVAAWLFNEGKGTVAKDATGNGHDGQFRGNIAWTTGKFGGGVEFPGVAGTRIEVPHDNSLALSKWTVTAWGKLNAPPGGDWAVILVKDPANGVQQYALDMNEQGRVFAEVTAGGNWSDCGTTSPAYDNMWHFLASSYDGANLHVYFDGKQEREQAFAAPDQNTAPIAMGGRLDNSQPLLGVIDEVGLFKAALEENDLASLMKTGFGGVLAVEPTGKLSLTWGAMKRVVAM